MIDKDTTVFAEKDTELFHIAVYDFNTKHGAYACIITNKKTKERWVLQYWEHEIPCRGDITMMKQYVHTVANILCPAMDKDGKPIYTEHIEFSPLCRAEGYGFSSLKSNASCEVNYTPLSNF